MIMYNMKQKDLSSVNVTFWGLSYIIGDDGVSYIFGGKGLS